MFAWGQAGAASSSIGPHGRVPCRTAQPILRRTEGQRCNGVLCRDSAQLRRFHDVLVLGCTPRSGPLSHNHATGGGGVGRSRGSDVQSIGVCRRYSRRRATGCCGSRGCSQLPCDLRSPAGGQGLSGRKGSRWVGVKISQEVEQSGVQADSGTLAAMVGGGRAGGTCRESS